MEERTFEVMQPEPNPLRLRAFFARLYPGGLHAVGECPVEDIDTFVGWLIARPDDESREGDFS